MNHDINTALVTAVGKILTRRQVRDYVANRASEERDRNHEINLCFVFPLSPSDKQTLRQFDATRVTEVMRNMVEPWELPIRDISLQQAGRSWYIEVRYYENAHPDTTFISS